MTSQLELRREIFSLLSWHLHHTEASPADTLNRLIVKGTGEDLSAVPWKAFERCLSVRELAALATAGNTGRPHNLDAPPILIQRDWRFTLLDGQKRAAHFKRCGRMQPVRCLVVRFRGG